MNLLYVPISAVFNETDRLSIYKYPFEHIPTFFLIISTFLNLNTAYYSKGMFIKEHRLIFLNYIKTEFLIDLFTIIPALILMFENYLILKLFLLIRIYKYKVLLQGIEGNLMLRGKLEGLFKLLRLVLAMIYIAHLIGCLWIYLAYSQINSDSSTITWLTTAGIQFSGIYDIYVNALYFSIVTMITVGYGDIHPTSTTEKAYGVVIMIISCGIFAYSLNYIGTIIHSMNKFNEEFRNILSDINYYMNQRGINKQLQIKIRRYLEYMHEEATTNASESRNILINTLSNKLKEEFFCDYYGSILRENGIFKKFSNEFIEAIVNFIEEVSCSPGEILYLQDEEKDKNLYFVLKGEIEMVMKLGNENELQKREIVIGTIKVFFEKVN